MAVEQRHIDELTAAKAALSAADARSKDLREQLQSANKHYEQAYSQYRKALEAVETAA